MSVARPRLARLAVAGGVAAALCWMPLGLAPLMPLAWLLALRGLRHAANGREAVRFGLIFGAVRYAVAGSFLLALVSYSWLGILLYLLAVAFVLPFSATECWAALWLERRSGLPRPFGYAIVYTLFEKLRTLGELSFPADLLAHGYGTHPAWLAWTPWTGPFVMPLLVFGAAGLADLALEARRRRPRRAAGLALAALLLWLAPPATDLLQAPAEDGGSPVLRVGLIQPCYTLADKLDRARWPAMWEQLEALTAQAAQRSDLVIWPETTRPGPVLWRGDGAFADPEMQALADRIGVPILYGTGIARIRDEQVTALYNGAALVTPGGGASAWHGKQRLLPFVEGVPFGRWLGWDPARRKRTGGTWFYFGMLGNFTPGPRLTIFEVDGARIGVLVCYEGFYPGIVRRYRLAGANLLAVITNDAWWGRTFFAAWHARMIASRAREAGVPVVRAANTGVSSATDRAGRMTAATRLFEVVTLEVPVRLATAAPTPYARYGDVAIGLCLLALGGALVRGFLRRT